MLNSLNHLFYFPAVYLMDSNTQVAHAFDFDLESGNISNQRELFNLRGGKEVQDGMVIE